MTEVARYADPAYDERERARLWPRVWQLATHRSRLAEAGDYVVVDTGWSSILVVHDGASIRAFRNACPHRGHPLCLDNRGNAPELRCPYHHWRFGLDGQCQHITDEASFPEGLRERTHLADLRCEVRYGFVWICLSPEAPELDDYLGPARAWLDDFGLDRWALDSGAKVVLRSNWKASVDVHNEAYHLPSLHPEVVDAVDTAGAQIEVAGWHARIRVPLADPEHGENHLVYLFPNTQLNLHRDHGMVFHHRPLQHDNCIFEQLNLLRHRDSEARATMHLVAIGDRLLGPVTSADLRAAERLQSSYLERGLERLTLSRHEAILAHMHASLDAFLDGDAYPEAP